MRNEKTATGATDSRSVVLSKQLHVKSLAVALAAVDRENSVVENYHKPQLVDPAFTERGHFISTGAEATDGSPVATLGMEIFRLQAEYAADQGWIKPASVPHIMAAYSQVPRE